MILPKMQKVKLGKFTTRKGFLFLGIVSWALSMLGSAQLEVSGIIGTAIVIVTVFHSLVIISVIRRRPLHRRITEANVVNRSDS